MDPHARLRRSRLAAGAVRVPRSGEVLAIMRDLSHGEMTLLVVTHRMGFAAGISDRVLFLDGGCSVEEDPPERILEAPAEARTRSFLQHIFEAR